MARLITKSGLSHPHLGGNMETVWDVEREFYKRFNIDDLAYYQGELVIITSYNPLSCSIWLQKEDGKHQRISTTESNRLTPV